MSVCCLIAFSATNLKAAANKDPLHTLKQLQQQARQYLQPSTPQGSYLRQLLVLTAAGAALQAGLQATSAQAAKAVAGIHHSTGLIKPKKFSFSLPKTRYHMFAKKQELTGDLFAQPAGKDLSWLDEPQKPVAPRPQTQPDLFGNTTKEIRPNTYLSKQIFKNYWPRLDMLPLSEQQGLMEALDEAVARKKAGGRQMALRFLEQKAAQSASTSLYFVIAKRMLVFGGLLLASDAYFDAMYSNDKMLHRLANNPLLFVDADEQELAVLAQNPQAVDLCAQITHALSLMAESHFDAQELAS